MAKAETGTFRAPRGAKPVRVAFFNALDAAPEAQRVTIARAAQVMIRDELRLRRERAKAASDKARAADKARASVKNRANGKPGPATTRKVATPTVKTARKAASTTGKPARKAKVAASENNAEPRTKTAARKPRVAPKPVSKTE